MAQMTVSQAAKRLGIHVQSVRGAIHAGKIAAVKVVRDGGSPLRPIYVMEEEDVEEYGATRTPVAGRVRIRATNAEKEKKRQAGMVTVTEAAKEIGVSASHITALAVSGAIESVRDPIIYIPEAEVARLKREREAKLEAIR